MSLPWFFLEQVIKMVATRMLRAHIWRTFVLATRCLMISQILSLSLAYTQRAALPPIEASLVVTVTLST